MKVFSLDLSLTATGWALAVDGVVKDYGLVPGKHDGLLRLIWDRNRVMDRVDASKPDFIVMEALSFGSKGAAVHEQAGLSYMVRAEIFAEKIPYVLVAPIALKKFIVGTAGSAKKKITKDLVIKEIYKRFGHDLNDNNVADAVGLSYVGMALLGDWTPTMKAQEEVLATIRKSQGVPVKQTVEGW